MSTRLRLAGEAPVIGVAIQIVLAFLLSINAFHLTGDTVAVIMAVVSAALAVVVAWATKHEILAYAVGLVQALAALTVAFGFHLNEDTTAAVIAAVTLVIGLFNRQATLPLTVDGVPVNTTQSNTALAA